MTAPATTESVTRSYRFTQLPDSDGLTLEGYAAVFDNPTRIANAWEGDFTETIQRGAFARAVRGTPPVVQFDHGQHPLLGSIPIAALTSMREDDRGLFVSARIHDNWLTEPVRDAIKSGAIDGMSFRFRPATGGEDWDVTRENRTLTDVDVFELGPVVFPAYEGTEVSVRSRQFIEALQDTEVRHDLAVALLMDNLTDPESARNEPADEQETEENAGHEETPPEDEDSDGLSMSSAPNPATRYATLFAVEAALVAQRSTYESAGLSDD